MTPAEFLSVAAIGVTLLLAGLGAIWHLGKSLGSIETGVKAVHEKVDDIKDNHLAHIYADLGMVKEHLLSKMGEDK
jgi:hypothetical protein